MLNKAALRIQHILFNLKAIQEIGGEIPRRRIVVPKKSKIIV